LTDGDGAKASLNGTWLLALDELELTEDSVFSFLNIIMLSKIEK